jgi:hypothetical protein
MDLNPDEALAAGWLSAGSLAAKGLESLSRFSLRRATKTVVLDHFMEERILAKDIEKNKIEVIPPWSHDANVRYDAEGRSDFRKRHGLDDKFVIMYSGNHSPCHPLDTILEAAKELAGRGDLAFLFVGGGSQFAKVKKFGLDNALSNVVCLPYQPMDQLAGSLSAADLHLVVMGNPFVGLIHPCKIYNILRIGSPVLYIGPQPSHVSEILAQLDGQLPFGQAGHGEVSRVVQIILQLKERALAGGPRKTLPLAAQFSKEHLLPRLAQVLESAAAH